MYKELYTISNSLYTYSLVVFRVILLCVVLRKKEEYNRAISRFWEVAIIVLQKDKGMNDTVFLQAPKDVFYCEGVITENGECVPLTVFDKLVYFHMLDRKRLFVDRGGKHFEGQDTIAEVVQINRKTAIASLKKLMEVGLITGHKETHPSRGYSHWVYTDVNTSPKVYGDKRKNIPTPNTKTDNVPDWEDEPPPF